MFISAATLATNLACKLNEATHQTWVLPLLIFYPTARCNSRCVSCDWWQADGTTDLTLAEIETLVAELPGRHTRRVLFSGGEPLLRREVFEIADMFRARELKLSLLTSGLLLERYAEQIAPRFEAVTISLDGHTLELYQKIRGVDGLALVERGVARLQSIAPHIPICARSTLHRYNYAELARLIDHAREMNLARVSFLAADVTSKAFGRDANRASMDRNRLRLDANEVRVFERVVKETIQFYPDALARFVAESEEKLSRLPRYYAAHLGQGEFPAVDCNAPWVSAVVEADGSVRPCYFHRAVGNIREKRLGAILRGEMVAFRRGLNVAADDTCRKCVCTLKIGLRSQLW